MGFVLLRLSALTVLTIPVLMCPRHILIQLASPVKIKLSHVDVCSDQIRMLGQILTVFCNYCVLFL